MKNDDAVNFDAMLKIAIERKKYIGFIIVACVIFFIGISMLIPKHYESITMVQTRSAGKEIGGSGAATMASVLGLSIGSSSGSVENYIALMESRRVLEPVIDSLEWKDEKSKPDPEGFAKKNIEIKNTKKTNIITIKGKGKTPEDAQKISQGIVDNFLIMQTEMNQQTQSLLLKFLDERIEKAKEESKEASDKLVNYSKEYKIYEPDGQVKMAVEKMSTYDKSIADMEIQQKSAQAEYEAATAQINQQKIRSKNFNINDNNSVQKLRDSIVEQQIQLANYQQTYTDENPVVIKARESLENLNRQLVNEVNLIVDAGTVTLNPLHGELLTNQAVSEVKISVAKASENALREKKSEVEKEMNNLPDNVMTYLQLESEAKLKQEVYLSLVKESEKDKVQEAMESMDIQVIDPANLPDINRPNGANTKLFAMLGVLSGVVISLLYVLRLYKRENNMN